MVNDAIFESVSMAAGEQNSILPPLRLQPCWQTSGNQVDALSVIV